MSVPEWRVVGESVCGTSHVKTGQPCQDAQGSAVLSDGTLVVAVADGAGSAIRAELGAVTAVRAAIETACARLTLEGAGEVPVDEAGWRAWLTGIFQTARDAVVAEAATCGHPPRDLASTLLLVVASTQRVLAAQVGDGAVVVADEAGGIVALTRPSSGEYLNETTFLVTDGALDRLQCAEWRGTVSHLAALTDGLQMLALKLPGGDPHPGFFAPLFRSGVTAGSLRRPGGFGSVPPLPSHHGAGG